MKTFLSLSIFCAVLLAFVWSWFNIPAFQQSIKPLVQGEKLQTLEIRFTAEEIMKNNEKELLADSNHSFAEPKLFFHPYLLMEVKYAKTAQKTGEGILIWSLVDGEMVLNSKSWETTHGFLDCIEASADREDFKVINALSSKGGSTDRENLLKILNVETKTLDSWIEKCQMKSLVVQSGNNYRLHIENPKLQVIPETALTHFLVSKDSKNAAILPRKFRSSQIESIARSAFGEDFAIRKTKEIYLPIYSIVVQNPDGTQTATYWNALNGKKLPQTLYLD